MRFLPSPRALSRHELQTLRALGQKKGRREHQAFLVEGLKSVSELLASDWPVHQVYLTPETAPRLAEALTARQLQPVCVSAEQLTRAGTLEHNDTVLAVAGQRVWHGQVPRGHTLTLALDGLRDPGNVGTILRLADWYGVTQVICAPDTAEILNPKTIAASMGSFLRVPVQVRPLAPWLQDVVAQGVPVAGAVLAGTSVHAPGVRVSGGVLVIGSESHGLSPDVDAVLTQRLTIPCFGAAESLNAAVATGILLDGWRRGLATSDH